MTNADVRAVADAFIEAMVRHDQDAAFAMLASDAQVFVSGRNVLSGSFDSAEHYAQTLNWIFREHDAGIDLLRCNQLLVEGKTAVAFVEERAHRDVGSLTYARIVIMSIDSGKITALRLIAEDPYGLDAFWE